MATTYLTRTPSSNGNQKTWTWSAWVKKATVGMGNGDYQMLFTGNIGNSSRYTDIYFREDYFEVFGGVYSTSATSVSINVSTNRKFTDPSAWYHLVVSIDTTQSTAANRVKIYVNGVQETSLKNYQGSTVVYPSQNANTFMNVTTAQNRIGASGGSYYFNGIMSHINFSDGYALAPTVFGETDSTTGQWKIKTSSSFTLGTNGFTILKDGNTITDQSSNSNNFALGGGTLTKTEDCPDNVFATWNASIGNMDALTNGNTTITRGGSGWRGAFSTIGLPSTGKFYCEFKIKSGSNLADLRAGIADTSSGGSIDLQNRGAVNQLGETTNSISYTAGNGNADINSSTTSSYGAAISTSNVLGMAVDMTNKKLYFSKDGTFQNSGNPTSGSTGTGALSIPVTTGDYFVSVGVNTSAWYVNFGNGHFGTTAVSSAGTNASGNGIFEYDVPSGYTALSTKGLNL